MTDDLRTRAREAASSHLIGKADFLGDKFEAFVAGALWHAAQQPTREQIARALDEADDRYASDPANTDPWNAQLADAVLALSELTEWISRHHQVRSIESTDTKSPGIECGCGYIPERMTWGEYAAHVAAVTEAETRAAVAADIRAAIYPEWVHQFSATVREAFGSGVNHAARITKGKQP